MINIDNLLQYIFTIYEFLLERNKNKVFENIKYQLSFIRKYFLHTELLNSLIKNFFVNFVEHLNTLKLCS